MRNGRRKKAVASGEQEKDLTQSTEDTEDAEREKKRFKS